MLSNFSAFLSLEFFFCSNYMPITFSSILRGKLLKTFFVFNFNYFLYQTSSNFAYQVFVSLIRCILYEPLKQVHNFHFTVLNHDELQLLSLCLNLSSIFKPDFGVMRYLVYLPPEQTYSNLIFSKLSIPHSLQKCLANLKYSSHQFVCQSVQGIRDLVK